MTAPLVDLLDDDPRTLKLLRLLVEQAGCRARTHAAAAPALAAMRAEPPDVAVIDVQLPGAMNGLDVVRALRADPATAGVAILVVSAFAALTDEARARAAGCNAWLAKPLDTREFLECIARLTRAPEATDAVDAPAR